MSLKLLKTKVAIIPIADPDVSPGGIIIPESAKQKIDQGVVKYRGAEVSEVKVGDHVIFSGYAGTKISIADEGFFYIMEERDVVAILQDGEAVTMIPLPVAERLIHKAFSAIGNFVGPEDVVGFLRSQIYSEGFEF